MIYEGKLINRGTIAYLKGLLSDETLSDPLTAESAEEKEIISAIQILSYPKINTDEEEEKFANNSAYEKRGEKTIGGISFGGTNKEILEQATLVRDCLKYNPLVKNDPLIATKELYKDSDTFELTLKDGKVLTFRKPIISEGVSPTEIASTEAYLQSFYEKYNKEALQEYYKSRKYKGKIPRIPYPHELFVFTNGEAKIRKTSEPCTYYEKVVEVTSVKEGRKKAKSFFSKKKDELFPKKEKKDKKETNEETNVTTKRHKVIKRVPGKEFFKNLKDYFVKEGEEEEWKQAFKALAPFAVAGVFLVVFKFTPFGEVIIKGLTSCVKSVPKAFVNASKLLPYFRGEVVLSSAMLSACVLNLLMLISLAGLGVFTYAAIKKRLKKVKEQGIEKVAEGATEEVLEEEKLVDEREKETTSQTPISQQKSPTPLTSVQPKGSTKLEQNPPTTPTSQKQPPQTKIEPVKNETLPVLWDLVCNWYNIVKKKEKLKSELANPVAAKKNEEWYYSYAEMELYELRDADGLLDVEMTREAQKAMDEAKKDGSFLEKYHDLILTNLDRNISMAKEYTKKFIKQLEEGKDFLKLPEAERKKLEEIKLALSKEPEVEPYKTGLEDELTNNPDPSINATPRGYLKKMQEINTEIDNCKVYKENLEDPIAAQNNLNVYFDSLISGLKKALEKGSINEEIYNTQESILIKAKNDGTLLEQHNDEIRKNLDDRIVDLTAILDILVERYEAICCGSENEHTITKGMAA